MLVEANELIAIFVTIIKDTQKGPEEKLASGF